MSERELEQRCRESKAEMERAVAALVDGATLESAERAVRAHAEALLAWEHERSRVEIEAAVKTTCAGLRRRYREMKITSRHMAALGWYAQSTLN